MIKKYDDKKIIQIIPTINTWVAYHDLDDKNKLYWTPVPVIALVQYGNDETNQALEYLEPDSNGEFDSPEETKNFVRYFFGEVPPKTEECPS